MKRVHIRIFLLILLAVSLLYLALHVFYAVRVDGKWMPERWSDPSMKKRNPDGPLIIKEDFDIGKEVRELRVYNNSSALACTYRPHRIPWTIADQRCRN